jgi:hypothetical protein
MTCSEHVVQLVEDARRHAGRAEPDGELQVHLSLCADCRERWDRERQLSAQLGILRMRTAALRSPDARRASLMRDFSRRREAAPFAVLKSTRAPVQSWIWGLSAAAALLAVFLGYEAGKSARESVSTAIQTDGIEVTRAAFSDATYVLSNDASALSSDDFVAVPYTPPLAPGEMVRMVHTDLYPEALASMGVEVDPSWAGNLPVDVLVGGDGLPRAVRIAENGQF